MEGEWSLFGEDTLSEERSIFAQVVDRGAGDGFVGVDMVEFDSGFEVVTSCGVERREIGGWSQFFALGVTYFVFEEAAEGGFRRELVRGVAVGFVAIADAGDAEAGVEHGAAGEGVLIAEIGEPGDGIAFGGALLGNERGDAVVGGVIVVEEQAGGEDVGGGEVDLG